MNRYIGKYVGQTEGPLLICTGGMHGNEPAGVMALKFVFEALKREPEINPDFTFQGIIVGLTGNVAAMRSKVRFIDTDLNRMWTQENVYRIQHTSQDELRIEEKELLGLLYAIETEIANCKHQQIVILDLHTTTADGGIFSIARDDSESLRIAKELRAPVITGMLSGLTGTTLHYFQEENYHRNITTVAFESGQHDDPLSVNRAIAAIINCMRSIGCVRPEDVENRHDALLINYSKDLPAVAELIMRYAIKDENVFEMEPGFYNFQAVQQGELLAHDSGGPVLAPEDGLILMPRYQSIGNDGFFLIREV